MVGDALMIAPVYTQNARGRMVYLPEDMMMVRLTSPESREYVLMEKGHHYVKAELNEMIFFLRTDKIVPLAIPGRNTDNMEFANIELLCNVTGQSNCTVYNDDGFSKDYENLEHYTKVRVVREPGNLSVEQSGKQLHLTVTDARNS